MTSSSKMEWPYDKRRQNGVLTRQAAARLVGHDTSSGKSGVAM